MLIFDLNGKFLFSLRPGKGPQEFTDARDFLINNDIIEVLDYYKIAKYDLDGKFIGYNRINYQNHAEAHVNPTAFGVDKNNGRYFWSGSLGIKDFLSKPVYALYRVNDRDGETELNKYFPLKREIFGNKRLSESFDGDLLSNHI